MKNNFFQLFLVLLLLVLLVLLSDPFMLWMPKMAGTLVLLFATLTTCIWAGFVMLEKAHDERELAHRMYAGRVAYLSGLGVLALALLFQGLAHKIDIWIVVAIAVMVVSKFVSRLYFENYK